MSRVPLCFLPSCSSSAWAFPTTPIPAHETWCYSFQVQTCWYSRDSATLLQLPTADGSPCTSSGQLADGTALEPHCAGMPPSLAFCGRCLQPGLSSKEKPTEKNQEVLRSTRQAEEIVRNTETATAAMQEFSAGRCPWLKHCPLRLNKKQCTTMFRLAVHWQHACSMHV